MTHMTTGHVADNLDDMDTEQLPHLADEDDIKGLLKAPSVEETTAA